MKSMINLASRPYRNRRLFWLAILALVGVSAFFGLRTLDTINDLEAEIARMGPQLDKKQKEANQLKEQAVTLTVLSDDQTLSLLAAQDLIWRKSFSWSRLLTEMERNIPGTVRVRKIALKGIEGDGGEESAASVAQAGLLQNNGRQAVSLSFEVTGKSSDEILKMIGIFQRTGYFEIAPNAQRNLEETGEVEFDLDVTYYPPYSRGSTRSVASHQVASKVAEGRKQ